MEIDSKFLKREVLADGRDVVIRAVRPGDKPLFVDALNRSSLETVYGRFLSSRESFSEADLRYLTELDGYDHFALGAEYEGRGVGVARFIRDKDDRASAELSFAVDEEFRRVGLGKALLDTLIQAAVERCVSRLICLTLAENVAAAALLKSLGFRLDRIDSGLAVYVRLLQSG